MAFVRQGCRPIPTALGNGLLDPFLKSFVRLMHQITDVNNMNRPTELHHLILGIAGFSVGIAGWGDRTQGYFKFLLDADAARGDHHWENNTYVVPVVEPRVVDGFVDEV